MDEYKTGIIFVIILFVVSGIFFYWIWFKNGATKLNRITMEDVKDSVDPRPNIFYKLQNHPIAYKLGSLVIFLGSIFALIISISKL